MSKRNLIVDILIAGACLLIALLIFPKQARAQVTDKPITTWPTEWTGVVTDFSMNDKTGCIAGWSPAVDKYGEQRFQMSFVDGARLTGAGQTAVSRGVTQQSVAQLAAARNVNVRDANGKFDTVAQPCYDKLKAPPPPWVVAPSDSGRRPVYRVNADGTRGAQAGYASTTITGNGKTGPNWCECYVLRSKETTSSTYCQPALFASQRTADDVPLQVVTLCRRPN